MKYLFAAPFVVCAALPLCAADSARTEAAAVERARQYYELMVTGKLRASEAFVCESSLDAYYSQEKHALPSAKVQSAKLTTDGSAADVAVVIEDDISFGTVTKRIAIPQSSHWRFEKRRWCLDLVPTSDEVKTPFGMMKMGAAVTPGTPAAPPPAQPKPIDLAAQTNRIEFSKQAITLLPDENGHDAITITNGLAGVIKLEMACPNVSGLECKLSEATLMPGKKAELELRFTHGTQDIPADAAVTLTVIPFGRSKFIPIRPR